MSMLLNPFGAFGVTSGSAWDALYKLSFITLSNGNLTATMTSGSGQNVARGTSPKTAGKVYFEVTSGASTTSVTAGIAPASPSINQVMGYDNESIGVTCFGVILRNNVSEVFGVGNWANGGTMAFAIDVPNRRFWCRKVGDAIWNNEPTADPATNVSGGIINGTAAIYTGFSANTIGHSGTINFGASAFLGTVPSGFTAWG